MNPLKRLFDLFPKQKTFYGQVITKNFDTLTIQLIGGGLVKVISPHYATTTNQNEYVWLSYDNGNADIKVAPSFSQTFDILI